MRIVETLQSPRFRTVIYTLDTNWYVEFEAGPMKQGYKFPKEKFASVAELKNAMNETFLEDVYAHFNGMFLLYKKTL